MIKENDILDFKFHREDFIEVTQWQNRSAAQISAQIELYFDY